MEFFDCVDEQGNPTGETIERTKAHREGVLHRTAHVWLVKKVQGEVWVLLQKRCQGKDSFPGCYDISSAGHIPAGMDYVESAIRELQEELGLNVSKEELIECGYCRLYVEENFYGEDFVDNQLAKVFLLWKDVSEEELTIQEEEIESVLWMPFIKCLEAVEKNTIPHCMFMEELKLLEEHLS